MLEIRDLETSYGRSQVLFKVNLSIGRSQVVSLLGRNGMGKSTTVKSVMGICRPTSGKIEFNDALIHGWPSYRIAQAGLGLVPEGRQVFPELSVEDNIRIGAHARRDFAAAEVDAMLKRFPMIERRRRSLLGKQRRRSDSQSGQDQSIKQHATLLSFLIVTRLACKAKRIPARA